MMSMTSNIDRLIETLCKERGESVPPLQEKDKHDYFRALCNVRPPLPVSAEFLRLQDEYLSEQTIKRGIVDVNKFVYTNNIALWQGDITRLNADAVVNACNSALLGCFHPLHNCIDNIIHSNAGVQVRLDCYRLMRGQTEKNGNVKVTKAYNLPSKYIFHTVGPIVRMRVTEENGRDLKNCYLSCLKKAKELHLKSVAFCCISTGVYSFPHDKAAEIAVGTVCEWKNTAKSDLKIIFNVFKDEDRKIYENLLKKL